MIGGVLNLDQLFTAINETIYMTLVSLVLATILGLLIGILLYTNGWSIPKQDYQSSD